MTSPLFQEIQRLERTLNERSLRLSRPLPKRWGALSYVGLAVAWIAASAWSFKTAINSECFVTMSAFFVAFIGGMGAVIYLPDLMFPTKRWRIQGIVKAHQHVFKILRSQERADLVDALKLAYEEGNNNTSWWREVEHVLHAIQRAHGSQDVFLAEPVDIVEVESQWVEADIPDTDTARQRVNG